MNNLFIFDLDGVLINTTDIHFECLNKALSKIDSKYIISYEEHILKYNGLSTKKKLEILTKEKNLSVNNYDLINNIKQEETFKKFNYIKKNDYLIEIFEKIKYKNIKIAVASNCIKESVKIALSKLNLINYIDIYLSNEDVINSKPFPEIYWKCMIFLNSIPKKTVIFEDSDIGILGATETCSNIIKVDSYKLLTYENIQLGFNFLMDK